jgi:replicative DNA helicase
MTTRNENNRLLQPNPGNGELSIEYSILNGFINDLSAMKKMAAQGFSEKMLKSVHARRIYEAIQIMCGSGSENSIDFITVRDKLKELELFDETMADFYNLVETAREPQLGQIMAYMKILRKTGIKNRLSEITAEINRFLEECDRFEDASYFDFISELSDELRDISRSQASKNIQLIKNSMIKIAQDVNMREVTGERDCLGYSVKPFTSLNESISGLRRGFLYGIAGAPRRGKTNFTLELATLVASNNKIPVLFFTWEQTSINLTYRLLAKESRINPDTLQRRRIKSIPENDSKFAHGWLKMERYMSNLYIIEGSREDTIDRIRAQAYNAMQDHKTDEVMIVCDYIQKMPLGKSYDSEKFKVEEISTDLKRLSIELNCPVIVVSSLNKEGCLIEMSTNDDARPELYHCKGSGDIEYDLDCAMILSKDRGDSRELQTQMAHIAEALGKDHIHLPKIDIVNIYLDKNRDAPEGRLQCIQYFFFIEENRFFELGYKETASAFRYNKIEALLKRLMQEGFVKFRDF